MKKTINDTYAEINLQVLKKNFKIVKKYSGLKKKSGVKICSIVKANAYGHGMKEVAKALTDCGTDYLGTASYPESIELYDYLKKSTRKKFSLLCLGILSENKKFFEDIVKREFEVTISDIRTAEQLNEFAGSRNRKIRIQIKADTGMNRIGFTMNEIYDAIIKLMSFKNLEIKGIYSHFAESEIPDNRYSLKQLRDFISLIKEAENNLMKFELKHICNTGGILNYNDPAFNMVRPGISLYGYYPDRKRLVKDIGIKPVMTFKSKISLIKTIDRNQSVSYGRKYFTKRKTKIASIPAGYGDGYSRLLTNKSKVKVNNKFYRISGTVCMDWIMADIGDGKDIKVNDEVILFGEEYTANDLSDITGNIPYEILCGVSSRVQRVYI